MRLPLRRQASSNRCVGFRRTRKNSRYLFCPRRDDQSISFNAVTPREPGYYTDSGCMRDLDGISRDGASETRVLGRFQGSGLHSQAFVRCRSDETSAPILRCKLAPLSEQSSADPGACRLPWNPCRCRASTLSARCSSALPSSAACFSSPSRLRRSPLLSSAVQSVLLHGWLSSPPQFVYCRRFGSLASRPAPADSPDRLSSPACARLPTSRTSREAVSSSPSLCAWTLYPPGPPAPPTEPSRHCQRERGAAHRDPLPRPRSFSSMAGARAQAESLERECQELVSSARAHDVEQAADGDGLLALEQPAANAQQNSESHPEGAAEDQGDKSQENSQSRQARRRLLNVVNRVQTHDVLSGLEVTGLDWEGRGVVRLLVRAWRQTFSFAFFRALPGEKLALRIDRTKAREGRKLDVSPLGTCNPSDDERQPVCRHFDRHCGGCGLLHLSYEAQLREKMALLVSTASRETVGGANLREALRPVVPSPNEMMYRNRSDFLFLLKNGPQLGHFRFDSPHVVDIPQCPKLMPAGRRVYKALREKLLPMIKESKELTIFNRLSGVGLLKGVQIRSAADEEGVERVLLGLVCSQTLSLPPALSRLAEDLLEDSGPVLAGVVAAPMATPHQEPSDSDEVVLAGSDHVIQSLGPAGRMHISLRTSFPTNGLLLESFCKAVIEAAAPQPQHVVWDMFASSGLFSLLFARQCKKVFAFDSRLENIAEMETNLSLNDVENVSAYHADLSSRFTYNALSRHVPSNSVGGVRGEDEELFDGESNERREATKALPYPQKIPGLYDSKEENRRRQAHLNRIALEALRVLDQEELEDKSDETKRSSVDTRSAESSDKKSRNDKSMQEDGRTTGGAENGDRFLDAVEFSGLEQPDVLILQPPRLGCDKALRRWLRRTKIPRIVYISRHPPSMFRDIGPLTYLGYKLDAIQPLDMFPHSVLVMCVASLTYVGRAPDLFTEQEGS
ncbi:hypothetical protein BESB_005450 [Besnoitia besnoiti]|uniref:Uncharacterized protein n=1 Tax=Besnoitia besnoiti TaxID=94643 RepID=A0A2A9MLQ4_BESBE|nr:hypothetical protein BESB_005450 [Besnoitia besnoiti]PFH38204.1 hypothetical protein BESB_005450 [Besnoitia besnoiti]